MWGGVLISSAFFAPELSGRLKGGGFEGANSEAEQVQDLMTDRLRRLPGGLDDSLYRRRPPGPQ